VPVFAPPLFKGQVASFTDANAGAGTADFTATIDWGDGTPLTAGTISQPGGVGPFIVSGSHTYADSGTNGGAGIEPIQVLVVDDDGSRLTITNTATVTDNAITLTGFLNPASDTGKSHTDAITDVNQPNLYGVTEPLAHVHLFANGVAVGQTQAGSDGTWSITTTRLADGSYTITATACDQFGVTSTAAPVQILPNATQGKLVIDTVGPRITAATYSRLTNTATFTFQDVLQDGVTAGGSGPLVQSLSDAANFVLNRVHPRPPGTYIVTSITVVPGATADSEDVTVVFNNGKQIKGGFFLISARSASVLNPSGIQDVAGNALDGEFYGPNSASGNGVPGGDFVAKVRDVHMGTPGFGNTGPLTIIGFPHPNDPAGNFQHGSGHPAKVVHAKHAIVHRHASVRKTTPKPSVVNHTPPAPSVPAWLTVIAPFNFTQKKK
jgi:hypothetical protein